MPDWPYLLLIVGAVVAVLGTLQPRKKNKAQARGPSTPGASAALLDLGQLSGEHEHPVLIVVDPMVSPESARLAFDGVRLDTPTAVIDLSRLLAVHSDLIFEIHALAARQPAVRRVVVIVPSTMMLFDAVVRSASDSTRQYRAFTPLHVEHADEAIAFLEQREPERRLQVSAILDEAAVAFDLARFDATDRLLRWAEEQWAEPPVAERSAEDLARLVKGMRAVQGSTRARALLEEYLAQPADAPLSPGVRRHLTAHVGYCLVDVDRHREAITWLERARAMAGDPGDPPQEQARAESMLTASIARAQMDLGEFADALATFGEVDMDDAAALHNIACCHQRLGDDAAARQAFETAHARAVDEHGAEHPDTIDNLLRRAECHLAMKETDAAREALDRADRDAKELPPDHLVRQRLDQLRARVA